MQKEYYFKSILGIFLGLLLFPIGFFMGIVSGAMIIDGIFINPKLYDIYFILCFVFLFFCSLIMLAIPFWSILTHINSRIILNGPIMKKRNLFRIEKEYNIRNISTISIKKHHLRYGYINYAIITFNDGSKCSFYDNNPKKRDFEEIINHLDKYRNKE